MQSRTQVEVQAPRRSQTGQAYRLIDPANLNRADEMILWVYLQEQIQQGNLYVPRNTPLAFTETMCDALQRQGISEKFKMSLPQDICLTSSLIGRKCGSLPDDYHFDVYSGVVLGGLQSKNGCFGNIEKISGTLKLHPDRTITRHTGKAMIGKIIPKSEAAHIQKESDMSRRIFILHAKQPTFFQAAGANQGAIVMRYVAGEDMEKFFTRDAAERDSKRNTTTTEKRLKLSRAFLRALKTQVHDNHITHRDIKPANVMFIFDPVAKRYKVTIIDYGLSTDATFDDGERGRGTPLFGSPEFFDLQIITQKSDIFGAAWILALLWRADQNASKKMQEASDLAHHCVFKNLFKGIMDMGKRSGETGLAVSPAQAIKNLLSVMSSRRPDHRGSLDDAIQVFDDILLDRKIAAAGKTCTFEHKQSIIKSHHAAVALRNRLDAFAAEPQESFVASVGKLRQLFLEGLADLTDDKGIIEDALDCLDIDSLQGLDTREQIVQCINSMLDAYMEQFTIFAELYAQVKLLLGQQEDSHQPASSTDVPVDRTELQYLHAKMERQLAKNSGSMTLDRLAENTFVLQKRNACWQHALERYKPVSQAERVSLSEEKDDPDAEYITVFGKAWGGCHRIRLFKDYTASMRLPGSFAESSQLETSSSVKLKKNINTVIKAWIFNTENDKKGTSEKSGKGIEAGFLFLFQKNISLWYYAQVLPRI
ncbi:hypothetical protein AQUSIP_16480 [Aquicella siphonis]|uniref:Protein kinase domain-containing protein n=1 Tax=Aquicella siphonis TaxID=254247 RepID=A0A5E4PIT1_9COXI|nr:protein kinase [Aquicella siphonis]VVC76337.1 hypothetical protein AQUSIP_16480 [Aquicella siphonis]